MAGLWDGIGAVIGKICQWIPGQTEALRNERDRLENEKRQLSILNLDINKKTDRDKAVRLQWVLNRLDVIQRLLGNKASS